MKHQKFVKQLMSMGHQRNLAEATAELCRNHMEPYATALERCRKIMRERPEWFVYDFLMTLPPFPNGGAKE